MKRNMMKKLSLILSFAMAINAGMFLKIEKIEYVLAAEINGDLSLEEGAILEIPRQDRILNAKKMWEIENQKNIESLFRLKVKGDINLSVPGFRQKETYYCGPATTKQTLAFFLKSNQVPDQDTLANKYNLRTTTDGTDMTLISGVINKYLKKYSSKIKYSMDNIGIQEEWKKKVLKSLSNNKQTDNEVSEKEKKIDKLKKGNIRYTKETKTLKYPIKGSALYGYSDKLLYFMKFGETGCKCYVSDGKKNKEVYKMTNFDYGFFSGMYENDLIEGVIGGEEQENSRNGSQLLIYRINKTGGEVIYSGKSQGMPKAKMVGDRLLFYTYNDKKGEGILNEYSFKTKKVNEIIRYNYKTDKNGKFIDGKVVYALDGFSKGVVFAVEIIEKDKEQRREVWYYDFEEEKLKKLPIVPEKEIDYIGGDLACVIIGDYDQNADNTGTMYLLKDDGTYDDVILPEITSGNDIYQSARISKNIIVLRTMQKFYLIDYKKSIYETITPNGMLEQGKIITQKGDKLYIYRDFKVEKEK